MVHWAGLSLFALFVSNVQVATRLMAAACPPFYWHMASLLVGQLGDGVGRLALGGADLDGAQVDQVARHGGLGGGHALGRQQVDQLLLAGDRGRGQELADQVLALGAPLPLPVGAGLALPLALRRQSMLHGCLQSLVTLHRLPMLPPLHMGHLSSTDQ